MNWDWLLTPRKAFGMWMPSGGPGGEGHDGLQLSIIGPVTVGLGSAADAAVGVMPAVRKIKPRTVKHNNLSFMFLLPIRFFLALDKDAGESNGGRTRSEEHT